MKAELIKKLEELLRDKPISEIIEEVHHIEDQIRAALEEARHRHLEAEEGLQEGNVEEVPAENLSGQAEGGEEEAGKADSAIKLEIVASEKESDGAIGETPADVEKPKTMSSEELEAMERRFKELMGIFNDRLEKYRIHVREEEEKNYEEKKKVIEGLREIITGEQNIGQAINKFRTLQRKWKNIGNVPASKYRELQSEYSFEVERFNYTLSIIKGLKELDLQKNLDKKQKLVEHMKALTGDKSIKRMEMMVKSYQEEWEEAGPVPQEKWEEVRDAFREATHKVYERLRQHYDQLREQQIENLEKKKVLLRKAEEISELNLQSPKKWTRHSEEIQKLQAEWRRIGRAPKEQNDEVWEAFRGACNKFFDRKKAYFKELRDARSRSKEKKEEIIRKTLEWKDSEDWKPATEAIIKLQAEWKKAGPADRKDEQRLWTEFRALCDDFFDRKKKYFAGIDERYKENLAAKEALLKEIESFETSGDKKSDLELLGTFNMRWKNIGHIPKKSIDEMNRLFRKALDGAYNKLGLKEEEKRVARYKNKVEGMLNARHMKSQDLKAEQRALKERLRRTRDLIRKYETNISFFTVASGNSPLLDEAKKKIEKARQEAMIAEEKLKLIEKAIKSA